MVIRLFACSLIYIETKIRENKLVWFGENNRWMCYVLKGDYFNSEIITLKYIQVTSEVISIAIYIYIYIYIKPGVWIRVKFQKCKNSRFIHPDAFAISTACSAMRPKLIANSWTDYELLDSRSAGSGMTGARSLNTSPWNGKILSKMPVSFYSMTLTALFVVSVAANKNTSSIDTVWTVSVDPEKQVRSYSGKNKRNYSTSSLIKLYMFLFGDVAQNQEAKPGDPDTSGVCVRKDYL